MIGFSFCAVLHYKHRLKNKKLQKKRRNLRNAEKNSNFGNPNAKLWCYKGKVSLI